MELKIRGNVRFNNQYYSCEELNELVNVFEINLDKYLFEKNEIVGLLIGRGVEMIVLMFALIKKQIPFLPIDKKTPNKRIENIISQAKVQKIICDEVPAFASDAQVIYVDSLNEKVKDRAVGSRIGSLFAYVLFTSGSSGLPKGVIIGRPALQNFVSAIISKLELQKYKSILCATNYTFDIFFLESIAGLCASLDVILTENVVADNPKNVIDTIVKNEVDCVQFTPSSIAFLRDVNNDFSFLKNVKNILLGGESLPPKLLCDLKALEGVKIYNLYGPTESTVWVSLKELTNTNEITIGTSLDNVEVFLLAEDGTKISDDRQGEICIAGAALGEGYVGGEKGGFTECAIGKRKIKVYKTGDMGRYTKSGEIVCLGRKDRQVKLHGFRIELDEIDNIILKREDILYSCTILHEQKLVSFCKVKNKISQQELLNYCKENLLYYMIPSKIVFLDENSLMINGKRDVEALRGYLGREEVCFDDEENDTYSIIANRIVSITNINSFSIDTSIEKLNLSSIEYIKLIVDLEKTFEVAFEDEYLSGKAFSKISDIVDYINNCLVDS